MIEWRETKLSELCDSIDYGYTASATELPVGPKFLRITDIVQNQLRWDSVPYTTCPMNIYEKFKLHDGDIVIARTGATTGESLYISRPPEAIFASYLVRLRINSENDPRYIAYWLKSPYFRNYLNGVLGDKSAQPNASASTMTNAPIRLPRLRSDQEAVSSVLASLDDKIELNRRMNETLEAMAQAIFRDWFVDFGPTRRKLAGITDPVEIMGGLVQDAARAAELAALFPEVLADNGLPEGWEEKSLDQIATFLNGLALQKFPATDEHNSLPVIKIAELRNGLGERTGRADRNIPSKYIVRDGDFLFSWSGSLMAKFWTGGEGALNQHLFKVFSEDYPRWFYSAWVHYHMPEFQAIAASKATTMGHIQRSHLSSAKVVCPPSRVLNFMSCIMEPLVDLCISRQLENRSLAATRDLLLPKLMSGEIRLREAQEIAEAVP